MVVSSMHTFYTLKCDRKFTLDTALLLHNVNVSRRSPMSTTALLKCPMLIKSEMLLSFQHRGRHH